jgi:16S rRNA (cytosine1402-N4)-methyltransferase
VLLQESLQLLDLRPGLTVVDGTVGAGGHARAIARAIHPDGLLIGLDRDAEILAHAEAALREQQEREGLRTRISLHHQRYDEMRDVLDQVADGACDRVLLDLGVSSLQLDQAERGFSFVQDGPLDMRMNRSSSRPTAAQWLRSVSERDLVRVLREYGEERFAGRIARNIKEAGPIERTGQLADIVLRAVPRPPRGQRRRIHPATRVFQAIRIAVNDELGAVERGLEAARRSLRPGGRLVVISFHSLEDRIVKRFLRESESFRVVTRKPVMPAEDEIERNPRARSARVRCGVIEEAAA